MTKIDDSATNFSRFRDLTTQVENYERQLIIDALNQANGKIINAAKLLNVSHTTLQYKVKKYHIQMGVMNH